MRGEDVLIYLADEQGLEQLYPMGQAIVPLTLLLDEQGRIAEILSGWSAASRRTLEELAGR